jgi:hypothetical protein
MTRRKIRNFPTEWGNFVSVVGLEELCKTNVGNQ